MAPSNLARLEASRHSPRLETLERVAAALGVGVGDLLAGRP
jgi:transcriptional regulator with XRE-family HTH domain